LKKKVTILDASQNDLIPDQPDAPEAVDGKKDKKELKVGEENKDQSEKPKRPTLSSRADFDELAIKAELAKGRLRAEAIRERRLKQEYANMPEEEQRAADEKPYRDLIDDDHHLELITDERTRELMEQPIDLLVTNSEMNWYKIESKMRALFH